MHVAEPRTHHTMVFVALTGTQVQQNNRCMIATPHHFHALHCYDTGSCMASFVQSTNCCEFCSYPQHTARCIHYSFVLSQCSDSSVRPTCHVRSWKLWRHAASIIATLPALFITCTPSRHRAFNALNVLCKGHYQTLWHQRFHHHASPAVAMTVHMTAVFVPQSMGLCWITSITQTCSVTADIATRTAESCTCTAHYACLVNAIDDRWHVCMQHRHTYHTSNNVHCLQSNKSYHGFDSGA